MTGIFPSEIQHIIIANNIVLEAIFSLTKSKLYYFSYHILLIAWYQGINLIMELGLYLLNWNNRKKEMGLLCQLQKVFWLMMSFEMIKCEGVSHPTICPTSSYDIIYKMVFHTELTFLKILLLIWRGQSSFTSLLPPCLRKE